MLRGERANRVYLHIQTYYYYSNILYPVANGVTSAERPALSNEDATRNLQQLPGQRSAGRPRTRARARRRPTLPLSSSATTLYSGGVCIYAYIISPRRNNIRLISKLKTTIIYKIYIFIYVYMYIQAPACVCVFTTAPS